MSNPSLLRVDLRRLILILAILSALITLANSFYASYRVQRQLLIDSTLESNRVYATKLAATADHFLNDSWQQLGYSAQQLSANFASREVLEAEATRLRRQTNSFNSVAIVGADGVALATSPDLHIQGRRLDTPGALEALRERRPLISEPYVSVIGNLVVFISQPVWAPDGRYLGYVGGTIYLKHNNELHALLGEHFYHDGSYLYVVDRSRRLLYHPDAERVGEQVAASEVVDAVLQGGTGLSGELRLRNSRGIDMLAGYAVVPSAGWGVVAQRPADATLAGMNTLMFNVLRNSLPLAVLTLLLIWWLARLISRPLWQLADSAQEMDKPATPERIRSVHSWYFEAAELKRAMLVGVELLHRKIGKLRQDAQTDPLTGLCNRRGLELTLDLWKIENRPFAVLALDIDHFKQVNDRFGHAAGDLVLQRLARLMRVCSRDADLLCRVGGEEFLMLLADASLASAERVAERLRRQVEMATIEPVGHVSVSVGVAHWPTHAADMRGVLKIADDMLYAAKQAGRNCVVAAGVDVEPS